MDVDIYTIAAVGNKQDKFDNIIRAVLALVIQFFIVWYIAIEQISQSPFMDLNGFKGDWKEKICPNKGTMMIKVSCFLMTIFFATLVKKELRTMIMN